MPPPKILALQGGCKTWISLRLRFCGTETGVCDKRGNVCPGMDGRWYFRVPHSDMWDDPAVKKWCELGVHISFQGKSVLCLRGPERM